MCFGIIKQLPLHLSWEKRTGHVYDDLLAKYWL